MSEREGEALFLTRPDGRLVHSLDFPAQTEDISYGLAQDVEELPLVQDGDSLSSISARLLGSPNDWRRIFEANRTIMKNDPDRLSAGMTLVIPTR